MYLLFDIGGSHTRIAASSDRQTLTPPQIFDTPQNFHEGVSLIHNTASKMVVEGEVAAACGGVPGVLDPNQEQLLTAPNLAGWTNQPLKKTLEQVLNTPVFLENDAALAALGEATKGAGVGFGIVAYLTVSTGVGGARIVDGRIDQKSSGFEPGHQIIDIQNFQPQQWESLISGQALEAKYHQKAQDITNPQVWEEVAKNLALGLHNLIALWSPQVIVLGGGVMNKVDLQAVKTHLKETTTIFSTLPEIRKSQLGDSSGLWGGLIYLNQRLH